MESKKQIGIVFILLGLIISTLALSADLIGLGEGWEFGYKQISGLIVGTVAIVAGFYLKQKKIGSI